MALIDVVKCEVNDAELVYKFPSEDLRIGTQLVVYAGQTAFFVKGGKVMDQFTAGTYTIKTENIPLLNKVINLPFGGKTPFKAEVWFINQLAVLDAKWGTPTPIQLEDPRYGVIVPVRAFGQYGLKVSDPKRFLETLVGNMTSFTTDKVNAYFKGKIMSQFTNLLSTKIAQDNVSVLQINAHLVDMSEYMQIAISSEFEKYGLCLESFNVMSVNMPEDDPSFIRLKEAIDKAASLRIMGKDVYQMDRSFDVLETAAANQGTAGNIMNMGMGLGMGMNIGGQMGNMAAQNMMTNVAPPPIPQSASYYVAVGGQQQGPFDTNTLVSYIHSGQITADTLVWKQGMPAWAKISTLMEFANMFGACPPPLPPTL